ncbi:Pr6Pr family membrane protein [Nesterenkonia flava]
MTHAAQDGGWQHSAWARTVHGLVALLSASGLVSSLYLGWTRDTDLPAGVGYSGGFSAGWDHMLNQGAYFTFLSGTLVCLTSGLLALRPERRSLVFGALRLCGVVCIVITGLVFNLLLREGGTLSGIMLFNDTVLHVMLPVVAPLVWLVVGPRGHISGRVVPLSLTVPLAWLAVTLLRGPALDWYPYVILDVPGMGYEGVGIYIGAILLGYLVLACALWGVDRLIAAGTGASGATRSGRPGTSTPPRSCP